MTSKYNLRIKFYTYCNLSYLENIRNQLKEGVILKIKRFIFPAPGQFNLLLFIDCAGYVVQKTQDKDSGTIYHLKLTNIQRIKFINHINVYCLNPESNVSYSFTENEYTKSLPRALID
jgi:hypothetical protein